MSETAIVHGCLLALNRLAGVRAWRNNSGAVRIDTAFVRFGCPGSPDVIGLIYPHGRFLGVECKTEKGRQSDQQKRFQMMLTKHGGIYILCRSVDECLSLVRPHLTHCAGDTAPITNGPASAAGGESVRGE